MPAGPISPPDAFQDMRFPLAGIDRTMGFDRQPNRPMVNGDFARTTVFAKNVRAFDPGTDRARGGSRPGIHKYATNQVNGTHSIQDLNYVTVTNLITGGSGTVPGWGVATPNILLRKSQSVDLSFGTASSQWSFNSFAYTVPSVAAIGDVNGSTCFVITATAIGVSPRWQIVKNGSQVATGTLPGHPLLSSVSVCTDGTDYYAVGSNGGATAPGLGTFFALKVTPTGTVSWSKANAGSLTTTANGDNATGCVVISSVLYASFCGTGIVQLNANTGAAGSPLVRLSALTIRDTLGDGAWVMDRGQSTNVVIGPTGLLAAIGNILAISVQPANANNHRRGVVFWDVNLLISPYDGIFASDLQDSSNTAQNIPGGSGNFLSLTQDGTNWYALLGNVNVNQVGSNGFVVKLDGATGSQMWGSDRIGLNTFSILYSASLSKVVVSGPGVSMFLDPATGDTGGGGLGSGILGMADAGLVNTLTAGTSDDGDTVGGYNRALCVSAISNGTMKVLFQSSWQSVLAGTGTLSSTAKVIRSAVNRQKLYIVDDLGANYTLYDPATNTLDAWTATAGSMPVDGIGKKGRLIATWRGRTILSGLPEDPNNIFGSAQNDPRNFDYAPVSPTATQAFALNTAGIGLIPDIVTSIMPYSDDYLFVGCDHEFWRISGDPMAGGKIDLVSRQMGVAWGNAWCTDPFGQLYVFSNHCGVYTLSPNDQPTRISQPIDSILRDIDLRKVIVRLAWNDRAQGLHIFVTNYATVGPTQHYFWEQRSGAWQIDEFSDEDHNPLCSLTFQGNTGSNRVVLIGSNDGYVRFVTDSAPNDDGEDILSEIWHGPLLTKDLDSLRLKELQVVMGKDSGPVTYEVYSGRTAEEAFGSVARNSGTFYGGRSYTQPTRVDGHALYVRFSSSSPWAQETLRAKFSGTGMVSRRGA